MAPFVSHGAVERRSRRVSDRGSVPRLGARTWSFVEFVVATIIVAAALAAVSEIVFPLLFTGVLAVVFKPIHTFD